MRYPPASPPGTFPRPIRAVMPTTQRDCPTKGPRDAAAEYLLSGAAIPVPRLRVQIVHSGIRLVGGLRGQCSRHAIRLMTCWLTWLGEFMPREALPSLV
jgi:hypothetical protein